MFIHKINENNIQSNNLLNKKTSNFDDYNIEEFFSNLITPHRFNDIIGIYMVFNRDIQKEEDILIKKQFEENIDHGFTNVLHLNSRTALLVKFDADYDLLSRETQNIFNNLEKQNITFKCSVIYGNQSIYFKDFYDDMKTYYASIKHENTIIISNYYEYMFKKNNP